MALTHSKVSTIPDSPDATLVRPSDWNAPHAGMATPEPHAHPESDVTSLVDDLSGKVGTSDSRLSDARTPLAHGHTEGDTTNLIMDLAAKETPIGAQAKVTTHEGAADPHTGYQKESERNSVSGYAGLDASSKLDGTQQVYGSAANTACQGNDSRLSDPRTPTAHKSSHEPLGGDAMTVDAVIGTGSLRTIGTGAQQACAGNDARLSDSRTPTVHGDSLHGADVASLASGKVPTAELGGAGASGSNFLRGDQTWAVPGGGSDPWTYVVLASDFPTTSATAVDVTGLGFTPAANLRYEFEAILMIRTATATVNPRVGLAWATGLTDGAAQIIESQAATGTPLFSYGNPNAALLIAVGGLPNTTQSWPANIKGSIIAGATPSGQVRVQLASETAGTSVTVKTGSLIRYRTY